MRKTILTIIITLVLSTSLGLAQVSHLIRYQGVLVDKTSGQPKPNGSYDVIFRIYEASTGGSPIWQEPKTIQLSSGTFSTLLGEETPLNLTWDKDYWLSIQLSGESEMSQRQRITPVPTALQAEKAQQLADSVYVDQETGNVGIGTPTPQATLDVRNSQTDTVLLLHCNGQDTSTTFIDQAGKQVTAYGDAQLNTASGSASFDGDGDYLSLDNSDDWNLDRQFTIDCWIHLSDITRDSIIASNTNWGASTPGWVINWQSAGKLNFTASSGSGDWDLFDIMRIWNPSVNTWYHLAITRDSSDVIRIFINGSMLGDAVVDSDSITSNSALLIGYAVGAPAGLYEFTGNIDEFRISNTARWIENFPDSLPTTMSTKDDDTKLLLHCDGKNGSPVFTDDCGKTVSANGDAHIDSSEYKINGNKFGATSGLFDGSGDYLSIFDSDDFNFGSQNFTIDFWVRYNIAQEARIYTHQSASGTDTMQIAVFPTAVAFSSYSGGLPQADYSGATTLNAGTWYHIAIVRDGSDLYIFVNGQAIVLTVSTPIGDNTLPDIEGKLRIGIDIEENYALNGWLDEFRISKGVALWKDTFPAPTKEYPFGGGNAIFSGRVGIGATEPTAALDLYNTQQTGYNLLRLRTSFTPSGSSDESGNTGDIAWDDNFIYVKTPLGWKKIQLNPW